MGAPGLHRSFVGGGTTWLWEDRRPHSWSREGLHAVGASAQQWWRQPLCELNRRLPGGYPGWPGWLRSNSNYVFKDLPRIIPATTWRLPKLAPVASFRTSLAPRISPGS
ncbi:hypothetical protein ILYODFUR_036428 [Ilyodon furcidens]|uniref:Uncharacterized protein n=1 Tax=Ilyodon furcidens TaxID=33524 RepID=A0ABV0UZY6_9TELE